MEKYKTYYGSIFGRKRALWEGMNQGKGALYRRNFVDFALNVNVKDNVLAIRDGKELSEEGTASIYGGSRTSSGVSVVCGTNLFFDETLPSLKLRNTVVFESMDISCAVTGVMDEDNSAGVMDIECEVAGSYGVPENYMDIECEVTGSYGVPENYMDIECEVTGTLT